LVSVIIPTLDRKKQLLNCVNSIIASNFKDYEIIIIDNGSKSSISEIVNTNPEIIRVITNTKNKGLACARNQGILASNGEYLLFVDDDNILENNMIRMMVDTLHDRNDVGIVAPKTFYKDDPYRIWFYGAGLNRMTSRAEFPYFDVVDKKNVINSNMKVSSVHNCFMIRKDVFEKVGMFDEKMFVTHTEFDLCMKAEPHYSILLVGKAICYHDKPREVKKKTIRRYGFTNEYRVYYLARNRAVIIKRYSNLIHKFMFIVIFYPLFTIYYSILLISFRKMNYLKFHIRGTIAGIYYFISDKFMEVKF